MFLILPTRAGSVMSVVLGNGPVPVYESSVTLPPHREHEPA